MQDGQKLMTKLKRFAWAIVREYTDDPQYQEDWMQDIAILLIELASHYQKPEAEMLKICRSSIRNAIYDKRRGLRSSDKLKDRLWNCAYPRVQEDTAFESAAMNEAVERVKDACMTDMQTECVELALHGYTNREIGLIKDVHESTISRVFSRMRPRV